MQSYNLAIIASIMTASFVVGTAQASYTRLNTYLMDKVGNDEVSSNLEAASKWLKEQEQAKVPILSTAPIGDLRKFTALQQVIGDEKCDRAAYEILQAVMVGFIRNPIRRVDRVISAVRIDHAKTCFSVYPVVYQTKKRHLDELVMKQVKQVAGRIIDSDLAYVEYWTRKHVFGSRELFDEYVKNPLSVQSFKDFGYALRTALMHNAEGNPDAKYLQRVPDARTGKKVVVKDKIKVLMKKHALEPCRQYESAMGPDLFIPAKFDASAYDKVDESNRDFYLDWSYFRVCEVLTSDEAGAFNALVGAIAG